MGWVHWLSALAGFKQRFGELFHSCSDRIKKTKELSSSILTTGRSCFPIIATSWSPSLPWQSSQSAVLRWLKPWRNVFRALRPPVQRWASHHFCFYIFCHERFGDVGGTGNQDLSVHPYFFVSTLNHCFDHDDHKAWQIRPLGVEIIASDKCQPPPRLHDVPGERWLPSHL